MKSALITLALVIAVFILGKILKRVLVNQLAEISKRTTWKWDDILDSALQKIVIPLSVVGGLIIAIHFWDLPPEIYSKGISVLIALLVLVIAQFMMSMTKKAIWTYFTDNGRPKPSATLTKNIINSTILILGFFTILHLFGISITPLLAAVGVGSIGISLAAQDTLSNLFAGIYISLAGNIRGGDYIKLGSGEEGYIADITWRETRLKMRENNLIAIPNGTMARSVITNYNLPARDVWVTFDVTVDSASDLDNVEKVTLDVARELHKALPDTVADYEPKIRYTEFKKSAIKFQVLLGAKTYEGHYLLKHELIKRLHKRYDQEKIIVAS